MIRPPGPWRMYWKTLEGLVLWMDFNQCQAIDLSGHGNNGTIYGAQCVQGRSGRALSFDGVDDYVDCGNDTSLNPKEITISVWLNLPMRLVDYPDSYWAGIVYKGTKGEERQYGCRIHGDFDAIDCHVQGVDGFAWAHLHDDDIPPPNTWFLLTITYDSSGLKAYVNDILKETFAYQGDIVTKPHNLFLGQEETLDYLKGTIDEVRIYNRALSEEEIKWLYEHT